MQVRGVAEQEAAAVAEARRRLGNAGIEVGYFLQFGYPGETRADIEATLDLVRETQPDDIGISVSYCCALSASAIACFPMRT